MKNCQHNLPEGQCGCCNRLASLLAAQNAKKEAQAAKTARRQEMANRDTLNDKLFDVMADSQWHTLAELSQKVGYAEPSVSAGIRQLRNDMGFNVQGEMFKGGEEGQRKVWRYRIAPADAIQMPAPASPAQAINAA